MVLQVKSADLPVVVLQMEPAGLPAVVLQVILPVVASVPSEVLVVPEKLAVHLVVALQVVPEPAVASVPSEPVVL